jgi:ATP-binding cassette subfamily B protein
MVAKHYGRHYTAQTLREKAQISREGVSMLGIAEAADTIGLKAMGIKLDLNNLVSDVPLPCILHWGQNHFVVLYKISSNATTLGTDRLSRIWGGRKASSLLDSFPVSHDPIREQEQSKDAFISRFSNNHPDQPEKSKAVRRRVFHIADPASGLVSYDNLEFERKWLGTSSEGIALLLEPTPRFYEDTGEEARGLRFSQLISILWQYKKLLFQLVLGTLAGSGLSLLMPFLTQSVVDVGIVTQDISFIHLILIAQLSLLIGTASIGFLRSWILLNISARLNLTILSEFLSKLMRLPASFFDVKQFGDIMQRIGDHHRIENFLTGQALGVLFSLFNLIVFGFVLAYFNLTIFLVVIFASILYGLWIVLFLRQRRKLDIKRFEISSRSQSQLVQLVQGMQEIKLSGAETPKRWEWEQTQIRLFKWNVKSLSWSQAQQVGALLINQGKNIFVTFLAAKAVIDGDLTLGGMVSVQYILGQFNTPIEQMIGLLQSWQDAQISLERLNEIHSLADEEPPHPQKRSTWTIGLDICLDQLTYTYPGAGNEPVLRNLDLTIPYGKTTAIVGTSGSGKTTLLKLLLRFYEPQHGRIVLRKGLSEQQEHEEPNSVPLERGSLDLNSVSHRAWRKQCGVVMQDGFIFSDTIARNIAVSDEIIDQDRLFEAARLANIHEFIDTLPLGYYTKIGAEGAGISQGQKQRILIARSLYKNPQLLLFDEATNALDAHNELIIVNNLRSFFKGRTVVIVAHRLSTVREANQIVVMEQGKIAEIGTHTELVKMKGKYYQLVSNQLELAEG